MKVELKRFKFTDKSTIGKLFIDGIFECYTLELPWLDNQNNISCIPVGAYHWKKRSSNESKYTYQHVHITDVPGRSWILIHIGNYPSDIRGCVLVGKSIGDNAVWNSKDAFTYMMSKLSIDGTIIITNDEEL